MKLTEKSMEVLDYVKAHGGKAALSAVVEATGRASRSISANVTDLVKKELAERVKETNADGAEEAYCVLTDAGMNFVPSED